MKKSQTNVTKYTSGQVFCACPDLNIRRELIVRIRDFCVDDHYYPDRRFQLLFFQISHGELIIRSHKNDNVRVA